VFLCYPTLQIYGTYVTRGREERQRDREKETNVCVRVNIFTTGEMPSEKNIHFFAKKEKSETKSR
jgi:hypothetical protein